MFTCCGLRGTDKKKKDILDLAGLDSKGVNLRGSPAPEQAFIQVMYMALLPASIDTNAIRYFSGKIIKVAEGSNFDVNDLVYGYTLNKTISQTMCVKINEIQKVDVFDIKTACLLPAYATWLELDFQNKSLWKDGWPKILHENYELKSKNCAMDLEKIGALKMSQSMLDQAIKNSDINQQLLFADGCFKVITVIINQNPSLFNVKCMDNTINTISDLKIANDNTKKLSEGPYIVDIIALNKTIQT